VDEQKQIPVIGIYAVKVEYAGVLYKAMLSIGTRPTIDPTEQKITIEVHIFDFNQEIYGEQIKVMFVAWVRNELKFDNLHQL
jgi:riboflavin kinase/FMN adenylyltransferase